MKTLRIVQRIDGEYIYNQKILESYEEAMEYKKSLSDLPGKVIRDCFEKHIDGYWESWLPF